MAPLDRRQLLAATGVAGALSVAGRTAAAPSARPSAQTWQRPRRILFAVKYGMVTGDAPMKEKFQLLKSLDFDGVELDSPAPYDAEEVRAAVEASGLPVHGVVDSVHWNDRLSSPSEETRAKGLAALVGALRDAHDFGGSAVLLVPGRVADPETENQQQCWDRSIACIREALPMAAEVGVRILIENVWNGFCYVHDGPADQSADTLRSYLDAIGSPWVGSYFDIGNHQKYGRPADWIRTLGSYVTKVDVKDWGVEAGWAKIGDGDVDWADVRAALAEIGFTGWATAEVGGGGAERLKEIRERMEKVLRA